MAQLASASGLGPEGPVFESQYPDKKETLKNVSFFVGVLGYGVQKTAQRKIQVDLQFFAGLRGTKQAEQPLG